MPMSGGGMGSGFNSGSSGFNSGSSGFNSGSNTGFGGYEEAQQDYSQQGSMFGGGPAGGGYYRP